MANPQTEPSMDDILASIRRIIAEEDEPEKGEPEKKPVARAVPTPPPADDDEDEDAPEAEAKPAAKPSLRRKPVQEALSDDVDEVEEEDEAPAPKVRTASKPAAVAEPAEEEISEDEEEDEEAADFSAEAADFEDDEDLDFDVFEDESDLQASGGNEGEAFEEEPVADMQDRIENLTKNVEETMLSQASASAATNAFQSLEKNVRVANSNSATLEDLVEKMVRPMLQQWLDENLPRIVEEKVEDEVRRLARR